MEQIQEMPPHRPGINFHFENPKNFNELAIQVIKHLTEIRQENVKEIAFVAGPIRKNRISKDMDSLLRITRQLEKEGSLAFSAGNIFPDSIWKRKNEFPEFNLPEREKHEAFMELSRKILRSGKCDRIYMAPDWNNSDGAKDEHKTAIESNIPVNLRFSS